MILWNRGKQFIPLFFVCQHYATQRVVLHNSIISIAGLHEVWHPSCCFTANGGTSLDPRVPLIKTLLSLSIQRYIEETRRLYQYCNL